MRDTRINGTKKATCLFDRKPCKVGLCRPSVPIWVAAKSSSRSPVALLIASGSAMGKRGQGSCGSSSKMASGDSGCKSKQKPRFFDLFTLPFVSFPCVCSCSHEADTQGSEKQAEHDHQQIVSYRDWSGHYTAASCQVNDCISPVACCVFRARPSLSSCNGTRG